MSMALRNIRQEEAVRAFVRLGGVERPGKGSHRVVNLNGYNLSIPRGILKIGLLTRLIKLAGVSTDDFRNALLGGVRLTTVTQVYTMMVYQAEEGGYWAEIAELPGCVTQGETLDELKTNMREAMEAVLERDAEDVQLAEVAPTETFAWTSRENATWTGIGA